MQTSSCAARYTVAWPIGGGKRNFSRPVKRLANEKRPCLYTRGLEMASSYITSGDQVETGSLLSVLSYKRIWMDSTVSRSSEPRFARRLVRPGAAPVQISAARFFASKRLRKRNCSGLKGLRLRCEFKSR